MLAQVFSGRSYAYGADWWSAGVLLYELLVGETPFDLLEISQLARDPNFTVSRGVGARSCGLASVALPVRASTAPDVKTLRQARTRILSPTLSDFCLSGMH